MLARQSIEINAPSIVEFLFSLRTVDEISLIIKQTRTLVRKMKDILRVTQTETGSLNLISKRAGK